MPYAYRDAQQQQAQAVATAGAVSANNAQGVVYAAPQWPLNNPPVAPLQQLQPAGPMGNIVGQAPMQQTAMQGGALVGAMVGTLAGAMDMMLRNSRC